MKLRTISSIVNKECREYVEYTVEERALPSMIDGLKPVQRYIVFSALKSATKDFKKIAAIGGVISDFGYNHGEAAALGTAALMANTWTNNYPILHGQGNFGSRIVNDCAEPRYIFAKAHTNFFDMFKDMDLLEPSTVAGSDLPKYYLPVLPIVLINGVSGIASGYSTKIRPHSVESVKRCVQQVLDTGTCDEPEISFPQFIGKISTAPGEKWYMEGTYEVIGKTRLIINEIPLKFDRVKYVAVLNALIAKDVILRYDEVDGEGNFCFKIDLKRDFDTSHANIVKTFKLKQGFGQHINVIDENGKLKPYRNASSLIVDFVNFRTAVLEKRIAKKIVDTKSDYEYAYAKVDFIKKVIAKEIVFDGKTRKQVVDIIESYDNLKAHSSDLVQMNLYHMTADEIAKLEKIAAEIAKEHEYWKSTTPKKQFIKDLKDIK